MSSAPDLGTVTWTWRQRAHLEASRIRAKMTRAQLADRMGVSEETVRRWERGGSQPSEDRLIKLIVVLALDGAELKLQGGDDDELPTLAKRLREERAERRITQAQAGSMLGVAQPTYAGWEVGRAMPDAARISAIADFLGVTPADVTELTAVPFVVDASAWPAFGRLLGERRAALRLTRDALAKRVGVTRSTIVNWELGYRVPRVQHLPTLGAALGVSVVELEGALPGPTQPLSALGNLVKARQSSLGLTRAEIAKRAGTDETTLSRWVHGHRRPDVSGLRRLAAALEMPFSAVSDLTKLA